MRRAKEGAAFSTRTSKLVLFFVLLTLVYTIKSLLPTIWATGDSSQLDFPVIELTSTAPQLDLSNLQPLSEDGISPVTSKSASAGAAEFPEGARDIGSTNVTTRAQQQEEKAPPTVPLLPPVPHAPPVPPVSSASPVTPASPKGVPAGHFSPSDSTPIATEHSTVGEKSRITIKDLQNGLSIPQDTVDVPFELRRRASSFKSKIMAVFMGGRPGAFESASEFQKTYECGIPTTCTIQITNQPHRKPVREADVLLFKPTSINFPEDRHSRQYWGMMVEESPMLVPPFFSSAVQRQLNFTISYFEGSQVKNGWGPSLERIADTKPLHILERSRGAPVAWIAQNCKASNRRQDFVQAMMKYINVHSFGQCHHNQNFPRGVRTSKTMQHAIKTREGKVPMVDEGIETTLSQYKFCLSFEESNCDDYVTEKFYRALYVGCVPVVMGAPNIASYAPDNRSYINAADFPGPRALAEHLLRIDGDDREYESYLAWRQRPVTTWNPQFRKLAENMKLSTGKDWESFKGYHRPLKSILCEVCHLVQSQVPMSVHIPRRCVSPEWDLGK